MYLKKQPPNDATLEPCNVTKVVTLLVRTSASRSNKAEACMAEPLQIQRHIGIGIGYYQPMNAKVRLDGIMIRCLHQFNVICVVLSHFEKPTVHEVQIGGRHD